VVVPLVEFWCVKKRIVVMFYVWSVIGGWSILPLGFFFRCVYCVGLCGEVLWLAEMYI